MDLFYCSSPLHVLIAERIIEEEHISDYYVIFDGDPKSQKQLHYFERLKKKAKGGTFIERRYEKTPLRAYANVLSQLWRGARIPKVKTLHVASLDSSIVRVLMSMFSWEQVHTFDDGAINLSPSAFAQMNDQDDGGFIRALRRCLFIPTVEQLKGLSKKHYSIYRQTNVMPNVQYIPLLPEAIHGTNPHSTLPATKEYRIFLGQRVYGDDRDLGLTARMLKEYNVTHYLPHPKEDYIIEGAEYIETPLIAEDYVLNLLNEDPSCRVCLYSYCSTALINLRGLDRVEVQAIKPKGSMPLLDETFELYASLGLPVAYVE